MLGPRRNRPNERVLNQMYSLFLRAGEDLTNQLESRFANAFDRSEALIFAAAVIRAAYDAYWSGRSGRELTFDAYDDKTFDYIWSQTALEGEKPLSSEDLEARKDDLWQQIEFRTQDYEEQFVIDLRRFKAAPELQNRMVMIAEVGCLNIFDVPDDRSRGTSLLTRSVHRYLKSVIDGLSKL